MLEELKREVCAANLRLVEFGLVILTWANVSAITPDRKYVVIKPSGVDYAAMKPQQMAVTDLEGNLVEGELRPSSDLMSTWSCTGHSLTSTPWSIPIPAMPPHWPRRSGTFPVMGPPTRTPSAERCPAPAI